MSYDSYRIKKCFFCVCVFFNDDVNDDSQAKALTLDDDDPLWHVSVRRCDWCFRIFAEPRNL